MRQFNLSGYLLIELTEVDAKQFHKIYRHPEIVKSYGQEVIEAGESARDFIIRIIGISDFIWGIRTYEVPDKIVGICALHHLDLKNKTIQIGGTLLPEYWGRGIMRSCFDALTDFAFNELEVDRIKSQTNQANRKAINLITKSGFKETGRDGSEVFFERARAAI